MAIKYYKSTIIDLQIRIDSSIGHISSTIYSYSIKNSNYQNINSNAFSLNFLFYLFLSIISDYQIAIITYLNSIHFTVTLKIIIINYYFILKY